MLKNAEIIFILMLGHWGGIFRAPASYMLASNSSKQTNIQRLEKFGDWTYSENGIEERLPYIYKQRLTTSSYPEKNFWGTITGTSLIELNLR